MIKTPKYTVGQEVWILSRRTRIRGIVTKVGRTLVTVKDEGYNFENKYRMDTGYLNGQDWGIPDHIQTDEEYAEAEARSVASQRLKDLRVKFDWSSRRLSANTMNAIADLVEVEEEPAP